MIIIRTLAVIIAIVCAAVGIVGANGIEDIVINVVHPNPWSDPVSPLKVQRTIKWNHGEEDKSTLVCWPEVNYLTSNVWSEAHYYDAHPTIDKKSYVLTKRYVEYEGSNHFTLISYYKPGNIGVKHPDYEIDDVKGNQIFWSLDGKQLIVVYEPTPYEKLKEVSIAYYELDTGKFIKKIVLNSYKEISKLGLVAAP